MTRFSTKMAALFLAGGGVLGCVTDDDSSEDVRHIEPSAERGAEGWIVAESDAPAAANEDHDESDNHIVTEFALGDGGGWAIETASGEIGVLWHAPPEQLGALAQTMANYTPLEVVAAATGTAAADLDARLVEHHERLARSDDTVPAQPRAIDDIAASPKHSASTDTDYVWFCQDQGVDGYGDFAMFQSQWEFVRHACPADLCGSHSNNNTAFVENTNGYYIQPAAASEVAMFSCNAGPIANQDLISVQLQEYLGQWWTFYTRHGIPAEHGVTFNSWGQSVQRFRMRVYNINGSSLTYAAAQW